MSKKMAYFGVAATLLLSAGGAVDGQERWGGGVRKGRQWPPRSGYDWGVKPHAGPAAMELTDGIQKVLSTNVGIAGAPAGTERMYAYRNASLSCVPSGLYVTDDNGPNTVFNETFTTGPGTRYIQMIYSLQANVSTGTTLDGLALQCRVTQGTTTVYCSNSETGPYLLRRNTNMAGNSGMVTYVGYVAADPDTPTTVHIEVTHYASGTQADACSNNLIVRY